MLSHKCKNSSPAVSAGAGQEDPPPDSFVRSWGEPSAKDKQGEVKQNRETQQPATRAQGHRGGRGALCSVPLPLLSALATPQEQTGGEPGAVARGAGLVRHTVHALGGEDGDGRVGGFAIEASSGREEVAVPGRVPWATSCHPQRGQIPPPPKAGRRGAGVTALRMLAR